jgi:hypothetical protein
VFAWAAIGVALWAFWMMSRQGMADLEWVLSQT